VIKPDNPCYIQLANTGIILNSGGGPMARLPQLIGRNRALEVLLSSEGIRAEQADAYGYSNRALPDAALDAFVEALATRIAFSSIVVTSSIAHFNVSATARFSNPWRSAW
jgi:enoyl-CoA hydratase/carnithine racemase